MLTSIEYKQVTDKKKGNLNENLRGMKETR